MWQHCFRMPVKVVYWVSYRLQLPKRYLLSADSLLWLRFHKHQFEQKVYSTYCFDCKKRHCPYDKFLKLCTKLVTWGRRKYGVFQKRGIFCPPPPPPSPPSLPSKNLYKFWSDYTVQSNNGWCFGEKLIYILSHNTCYAVHFRESSTEIVSRTVSVYFISLLISSAWNDVSMKRSEFAVKQVRNNKCQTLSMPSVTWKRTQKHTLWETYTHLVYCTPWFQLICLLCRPVSDNCSFQYGHSFFFVNTSITDIQTSSVPSICCAPHEPATQCRLGVKNCFHVPRQQWQSTTLTGVHERFSLCSLLRERALLRPPPLTFHYDCMCFPEIVTRPCCAVRCGAAMLPKTACSCWHATAADMPRHCWESPHCDDTDNKKLSNM